LQEVFNATRLKVWQQQPKSFFEQAVLDADFTQTEHLDRWDADGVRSVVHPDLAYFVATHWHVRVSRRPR